MPPRTRCARCRRPDRGDDGDRDRRRICGGLDGVARRWVAHGDPRRSARDRERCVHLVAQTRDSKGSYAGRLHERDPAGGRRARHDRGVRVTDPRAIGDRCPDLTPCRGARSLGQPREHPASARRGRARPPSRASSSRSQSPRRGDARDGGRLDQRARDRRPAGRAWTRVDLARSAHRDHRCAGDRALEYRSRANHRSRVARARASTSTGGDRFGRGRPRSTRRGSLPRSTRPPGGCDDRAREATAGWYHRTTGPATRRLRLPPRQP